MRAQVSVELVLTTAIMASLLLAMLLVNDSLSTGWSYQRQYLEATQAATQAAIAANRAVAGGSGTQVTFTNTVAPSITNITVFDKRAIRAYFGAGGYASAALVTNMTNITGAIPLNRQVTFTNTGGTITVE